MMTTAETSRQQRRHYLYDVDVVSVNSDVHSYVVHRETTTQTHTDTISSLSPSGRRQLGFDDI